MSDKTEYLDKEMTIELHAEGKDAWNKYMQEHPNTNVKFEGEISNCDFSNYTFSGLVNFYEALFKNEANFQNAHFSQHVHYVESVFESGANFDNTTFEQTSNFTKARLYSPLSFKKTKFSKRVLFWEAEFLASESELVGPVSFKGAILYEAEFHKSVFNVMMSFRDINFFGMTNFMESQFNLGVTFASTRFNEKNENCVSPAIPFVCFVKTKFNSQTYFDNVNFSIEVDFSCANFFSSEKIVMSGDGLIQFHGVEFRQNTKFIKTEFTHLTIFKNCTFGKLADFFAAKFHAQASFDAVVFYHAAFFEAIVSNGLLEFEDTTFDEAPNFLAAQMPSDVVDDMHIEYSPTVTIRYRTIETLIHDLRDQYITKSSEQTYRRLKNLAHESKNHNQEQTFFAMEMRAKRDNENNYLNSLMIDLYELLSNFGRSIVRPSAWLFVFMCLFTLGYQHISSTTNYLLAFFYSLSNCLPFGGLWRQSEYLFQQLFPSAESWSSVQQITYYSLITFNGLFGFVFIFLIGLGLRNRFRL